MISPTGLISVSHGAQSPSRLRGLRLGRFSFPSGSKRDEARWHNQLWPSCGYGHSLRFADVLSFAAMSSKILVNTLARWFQLSMRYVFVPFLKWVVSHPFISVAAVFFVLWISVRNYRML
jgi:hypothetical protein